MLLGGLWHGANIRFLLWGAIHGLGLVIEKMARTYLKPIRRWKTLRKVLAVFCDFSVG